MSSSYLRSIVINLLKEEDEDSKLQPVVEDSLDDQVDRFLSQYEKNATVENRDKNESYSHYDSVKKFLFEEEDEEADDSEEKPVEKLSIQDLNVSEYINDVMRLVDNFQNLVEVQDVVLARAKNFLLKNYNEEVGTKFDSILKEYGIVIGKSKKDVEDDYQAPPADRAGSGGGGGAP